MHTASSYTRHPLSGGAIVSASSKKRYDRLTNNLFFQQAYGTISIEEQREVILQLDDLWDEMSEEEQQLAMKEAHERASLSTSGALHAVDADPVEDGVLQLRVDAPTSIRSDSKHGETLCN